jgi:hypothetical protein
MKYLLIGLLLVAFIIFAPFITIWALNTLFNLGIAFNFYTWAAILWLSVTLFARNSK